MARNEIIATYQKVHKCNIYIYNNAITQCMPITITMSMSITLIG